MSSTAAPPSTGRTSSIATAILNLATGGVVGLAATEAWEWDPALPWACFALMILGSTIAKLREGERATRSLGRYLLLLRAVAAAVVFFVAMEAAHLGASTM